MALSADGNTLAVGASGEASISTGINSTPNYSGGYVGAVYVFTRSASGWSQQAYVKAANAGTNDHFGVSVALSADGNTLAVGANGEASISTGINGTPNDSGGNVGAVYVFARSVGSWSQQAYIKAANAGVGDAFGISVALSADGNTLAVGAANEDSNTTGTPNASGDAGAVYVFSRSASTWSQQAYVKASNAGTNDRFGGNVALSADGNTLAVGASGEGSTTTGINSTPNDSGGNVGAVYVFTRSASSWSEQAYVKASNAGSSDRFGTSVALSADGNCLAVGADGEGSSTTGVNSTPNRLASNAGAVYVFARSANSWGQQAYVKASNTGANDYFGVSVALSADGNALAVGAAYESGNGTGLDSASNELAQGAGAAYVFTRGAASWSQRTYIKATNTGGGDVFGLDLALSADGNTLAVGGYDEDSGTTGLNSTPNEAAGGAGAVYLY